MEQDYKQMLVSKVIVFIHLGLVALMAFTGCSDILLFPCMLWGVSSYMAIPLTEEDFYMETPAFWRYRHLFALGICFMISQSV